MFFTFRELAAVALTGADNYSLEVFKADVGKWVIKATILDSQKNVDHSHMLQTNRGTTKTWRYLDDVLAFVSQHCVDCRNLTIKTEGKIWRLSSDDLRHKP